jgi:Rrf2 family protein
MKFSSQEEYGLRCLLQVAKASGEGESLSIPEISKLEGLTQTHVAKLLMLLRRGGFIQSTRGQSGGYTLARPANQIYLGETLATLGGRLYDGEFCARHSGVNTTCAHELSCSVRSVWEVVQAAVDEVLDKLSLADLMAKGFVMERTVQERGLKRLPVISKN